MKRLPAPPDHLRFLLDRMPDGLTAALRGAVDKADRSGAAPLPILYRADVRRRCDGYFVWMRFRQGVSTTGDVLMRPFLEELLALPRHPSPPKELLNPTDRATGTTLGER